MTDHGHEHAELKVYRASFLSIAIAWPCVAVFLVIGVGITASARRLTQR